MAAEPDTSPPDPLHALAARFGIGEVTEITPLPVVDGCGERHAVTARHGGVALHYVLAVAPAGDGHAAAREAMLTCLADAGLPVPAPCACADGASRVALADGRAATLWPRLDGRRVHNPTLKQVTSLGRFGARAHRACAEVGAPEFPHNLHWLGARVASQRGRLPYAELKLLEQAVAQVRSLVGRGDVADLPRGALHGNLVRHNVLFNEHGLTGVDGWERPATGWLILDLAIAANDWCADGDGELDQERTIALLRAYHAVRPLTHQELWFLPAFALYAALVAWLGRLDGADPGALPDGSEDELYGTLVQRLRRFFYFDPRLLEVGAGR